MADVVNAQDAQVKNLEVLGNADIMGTVSGTFPVTVAQIAALNLSTLPTSNPGSGKMWINAANHNALTVGSGA